MSSIAAGTTTGSALVSTGDTTGELVLKTNGTTTAVTIDTSQNVTIEGSLTVDGGSANISGTSSAGANVKLYEDTDNGTNYVSLKAPDAIASDITWTLPNADGTNGQVLQTNGTGTLSWVTAGGSGDVVGPASATDNAVARFDGTTGKLIQNSAVTIADTSGDITTGGVVLTANGSVSAPSYSASGDTNTGMYFPAADTLGFTCGGTEDFRVDGDGQLWNTVQSEVGSDYTTLYKGYFCRAWVRFDMATASINASGNVSSLTDNGAGSFTINFATAFPDADYCVTASSTYRYATRNSFAPYIFTSLTNTNTAPTTSGYQLKLVDNNGGGWDSPYMCTSVFR